MAAILGLEDATVQQLCANQQSGGVVRAVNFNAPGQVVVAGDVEAVEGVLRGAQASGAKRTVDLPVSIPSHSPLMQPAADRLAERLAQVTLHKPTIPVINNVDVEAPEDPEAIADALVRQLANPVRWT
ncbi:MAG: ACP S-malonyltransferase, partial [Thiohalorhabdaceae bacterium]